MIIASVKGSQNDNQERKSNAKSHKTYLSKVESEKWIASNADPNEIRWTRGGRRNEKRFMINETDWNNATQSALANAKNTHVWLWSTLFELFFSTPFIIINIVVVIICVSCFIIIIISVRPCHNVRAAIDFSRVIRARLMILCEAPPTVGLMSSSNNDDHNKNLRFLLSFLSFICFFRCVWFFVICTVDIHQQRQDKTRTVTANRSAPILLKWLNAMSSRKKQPGHFAILCRHHFEMMTQVPGSSIARFLFSFRICWVWNTKLMICWSIFFGVAARKFHNGFVHVFYCAIFHLSFDRNVKIIMLWLCLNVNNL